MADEAHEHVHVDAHPARCYEVAVAFEDYPNWADDVLEAVVLWRDSTGQARRVQYRASALGRTIVYVLDSDFTEAPRSFSWTLVTGEMLRALDGRYEFEPDGAGTRVGYDLSVELAVPLPGLVKRRATALIVGTALRALKRAAEAVPVEDPSSAPETRPFVPPSSDEPDLTETRATDIPVTHPDAVDFAAAGAEERTLPAPSVLECIVGELLGAVPEVRDHVLEAADALLDAAKTLLDVADRVVRQQRGEH